MSVPFWVYIYTVYVSAATPNLSTVKTISVTEAVVTTLDSYNAGEHVDDDDITDEKVDGRMTHVRARERAVFIISSQNK